MSVVLQTGVMHYRENEQDQWRPLIIKAQSIDFEALVDPYEPTVPKEWLKGEYCLQDDKIWRCTNPVTTPADFDEDDWVQTTFGYEIEQLGIAVQDSEPNFSKVWIDTDETTSVTCPDMSEFNALENSLNQLKTDTFGDINLTGTNNTGSTITTGTFFYNNGSLVRAKTDIQNGSAITIGTNAETVTAGGLNDLNNSIDSLKYVATHTQISNKTNFSINIVSGNFTGMFYLSTYTSSGIRAAAALLLVKRHANELHISLIPRTEWTSTITGYTESGNTLTFTINNATSLFIDGYVMG